MKNLIIVSSLAFALLTGSALLAFNKTEAQNNINSPALDKGISLKVTDYSIEKNQLLVHYTVESEKEYSLKNDELIERPDVFINGQLTHPSSLSNKKINSNKYLGVAEINLKDIGTTDNLNVKFNTDAILNHEGQWTVEFNTK